MDRAPPDAAVLEEEAALKAIFGPRFTVRGDVVVVNLSEDEGGLDLQVTMTRSEFYPRELVAVDVQGDICDSQRAAFRTSLDASEFAGKPHLYEVLLALMDWARTHPDLTSEFDADDQAFLRASADGGELKRSRGFIVDAVEATARALERSKRAPPAALAKGKTQELVGQPRKCHVCGVNARKGSALIGDKAYCITHRCSVCDCALSNPVTVSGVSYCPTHAKSSSSRVVDVAAPVRGVAGDVDSDASFRATKQLVTLLVGKCNEGVLSTVDLDGLVSVLALGRFSASQERLIRELVSKAHGPEQLQPSSGSVDEIITLVDSFASRIGLVSSVVEWMRTFLHASRGGLLDYDPASEAPPSGPLDHLRLLNTLYKESFLVTAPSFADRTRGVATVARVMLTAGADVSLELFLKCFDADRRAPPEPDFGQSTGLTTGDLASLLAMLSAPMTSSFAALAIVQAAHVYIRDVADRAASATAASIGAFDFPYWPTHFSPTRNVALPQPHTKKVSFAVKSLAELDAFMMACLRSCMEEMDSALLHVENVVSATTLSRFRDYAQSLFESPDVKDGVVLPLVAWHGTPAQDNVDSIIASGILGAYDLTDDGDMIPITHGNVWGQGIYLSPSMALADNYATKYGDRTGQMFFSLVLLGRPLQLVAPSALAKPLEVLHGLSAKKVPKSHWRVDLAPHSARITPKRDMYIVFAPAQVLPFFLVTYGPKNAMRSHVGARLHTGLDAFGDTREAPVDSIGAKQTAHEEKKRNREQRRHNGLVVATSWRALRRMAHVRQGSDLDKRIQMVEQKTVEEASQEKRHPYGLIAFRVPTEKGMHWMLSCDSSHQMQQPLNVRLIFVLDKSASMGSSFQRLVLPSCKHLYRALRPSECQLVLFGRTVELIPANRVRDGGLAFFDSLQVQLEDATNFVGGIEKAVDVMLRDQEVCRARRDPDCLFQLVMMSDGCDTINTVDSDVEARLQRLAKMLQGSDTRCTVTPINITKHADTRLAMRTKFWVETVVSDRASPLVYARARSELPALLSELSSELIAQSSTRLRIAQHSAFEGFVKNLLAPPTSSLDVAVRDGRNLVCFIRGPLPRKVAFDDSWAMPLYAYDELTWLDDLAMQTDLLELLRRHVDDVSVAVLAGRDVSPAIDELRAIVNAISAAMFDPAFFKGLDPEGRRKLMKRKKQLLTELRELLNRMQEALLMRTATSDAQAVWLTGVDKLKYGMRALRLAKRQPLDQLHLELAKMSAQVARGHMVEHASDLCSVSSRLTTVGHIREMAGVGSTTLLEFLYSFGGVGLAARVRRSEACVIDPWRVQVEYVSEDAWDSASALCFLEAGVPLVDSTSEKCFDVIPVGDPRNFAPYLAWASSSLFRYYTSITFSQNPDVFLPRQVTALLSVALVRAVTQLLNAKTRTTRAVEQVLRLLYTLRQRMLRSADGDDEAGGAGSYWGDVLAKLGRPDVAQHLTEAPEDDIGSVAKPLACLLCLPERVRDWINDAAHLSRLSLALLAEAASRGCRIEVKMTRDNDYHALLVKALGISEESCVYPLSLHEDEPKQINHSDAIDITVARKRSGRFFRRELALSNCPPTAVLACLTLARLLKSDARFSSLDATLQTGDWAPLVQGIQDGMASASMSNFIRDFVLPDKAGPLDPPLLQVALYVQGLRHCTSATRRLGVPSLRDPGAVLAELARETRREVYHRRLGAKLKALAALHGENHRRLREALARERQRQFMLTHMGMPRVFTARDAPAGVVLSQSGLPMYVCSFPACARYLQPLGPKRFTRDEAAKFDAQMVVDPVTGVPKCINKKCKVLNRPLKGVTAEEAVPLGVQLLDDPQLQLPFVWLCDRYVECQTMYRVGPDTHPRTRHALYKHLAPMDHPDHIYIRSLHIDARAVVVSKTDVTLAEFTERLWPLTRGHELAEGESWIGLLTDLYQSTMRLWSKRAVGDTMAWIDSASVADQRRVEEAMLQQLQQKPAKRK